MRLFYEVYGSGEPTVLLLPTWSIIHSRHWKMQIPYLARHCRVRHVRRARQRPLRPADGAGGVRRARVRRRRARGDGRDRAPSAPSSSASRWAPSVALLLAAEHPERVEGAVFIAPAFPGGGEPLPERTGLPVRRPSSTPTRAGRSTTATTGCATTAASSSSSSRRCFTEPHSTKPIEDGVGWGLETDAETLSPRSEAPGLTPDESRVSSARRVRCPVLVIHGDDDAITLASRAAPRSRSTTGGELVAARGLRPRAARPRPGQGQPAAARLRRAARRPPRRWVRGKSRRKRALYISSPIGLGHAQRDVAIADELRKLHPDLEIDWLAQHPGHGGARGARRAHPSRRAPHLANESGHIESESAEHDLHCFQAIRRMDEILLANFMVFHDLVRDEQYDLWIGDEAWELDYYLHENPEQKRAAYVWLTDFVGWLPMADGGEREAFLTADYNAEMIEHIARFPRVRDRALFVGNADDIVPDAFGPDLPLIRDWTEQHYDFAGYVTGFDPAAFADREALRAELGYAARRAGLHRHRRRLGRRRPPAAARDRGVPGGEGARAGAADDRRRRAADRPGDPAAGATGSRSARTCTTSTATSPRATSRSCRAG